MLKFRWKKDFGGIAFTYLILSSIWIGMWTITFSYAGSIKNSIELIPYILQYNTLFHIQGLFIISLSVFLFLKIFLGSELSLKSVDIAILIGILIVTVDFIPIIVECINYLSGKSFTVPFTIVIMIFHILLLIQLWWHKNKKIEKELLTSHSTGQKHVGATNQ